MFLKQMKIVGFKSFVESTSLYFKSNRVAIVGPNGCGKSNVIDAIRWVMGESSPKYLRGDQMADVIFNGSVQRKPLGMAQVEITLDNQQGYLQGAYVVKGEVALRREVNRDGDSTYYINGQKVRRKDLTDLWLGTGAGARGYAIIGQNMVNHLVEANPEVLRSYLEEAAGVSKYKERRRESAERLKQVAENLSRIDDMILDLHTQLSRLEQEAQDAHRFHHLRQSLRQYKEQMLAAKARVLFERNQELEHQHVRQEQQEKELKQTVDIKQEEANAKELEQHRLFTDLQNQEQNLFKRRLACEQEQKFFNQRQNEQERYREEYQQTIAEIQLLNNQILQEQYIIQQHQAAEDGLETERQVLQTEIYHLSQYEQDSRQKFRELSQHKNQTQQQQTLLQTKMQVLQAKHEQGQMSLTKVQDQMLHWRNRLKNIEIFNLEKKIANLQTELEPKVLDLSRRQEEIRVLNQEIQHVWTSYSDAKRVHDEAKLQCEEKKRLKIQAEASYQGLLANLESKVTQSSCNGIADWIKQWEIPKGWQQVVDWLWQGFLPTYLSLEWEQQSITQGFYARLKPYIASVKELELPSLLELMKLQHYPAGFIPWDQIYVLEDEEESLAMRGNLQPYQSILNSKGVWIGADWTYVIPIWQNQTEGLATRLNTYKEAEQLFIDSELVLEEALTKFVKIEDQYSALKLNIESQQKEYEVQSVAIAQLKQLLQTDMQQLKFLIQEQQGLQRELERSEQHYAELVHQNNGWLFEIQVLETEKTQATELLQNYILACDNAQQSLSQVDQKLKTLNQKLDVKHHELTKLKVECDFYVKNAPKLIAKLPQLEHKIQQLQQAIDSSHLEPQWSLAYFEQEFQQLFLEQEILDAKKQEYAKSVHLKQEFMTSLDKTKQKLLEVMEKKWRITSEKEQVKQEINDLKLELNTDFSPHLWQNLAKEHDTHFFKQKMCDLEAELQTLGDVNLLAIGLYEQEKQRHEQLNAQKQDLQTAIEELAHAIETLDVDMQTRLRETLLAINHQLTTIFPQLFGGGEAKFVASCDNLLEANVAVHVQLPGKKQHRIQLLSGGEKALTAVALLFAIFALNPAPFCLLDEVDAALDDANVLRLATLIKNMSQTVQFILITHNPLSMDVAEELIGVTMQEPGVSRVVAVNMAMALAMVNKE